jgi:hypothetical protein
VENFGQCKCVFTCIFDVTLAAEALEALGHICDGLFGREHLGHGHHHPQKESVFIVDEAAVLEAHLAGQVHQESMLLNFFSSLPMMRPNKLECLHRAKTFQSSLTFAGGTRSLPKKEASERSCIRLALALPSNSKTQLERVTKSNPSSLLGLVISDEGKKFFNIDTRKTVQPRASVSICPEID